MRTLITSPIELPARVSPQLIVTGILRGLVQRKEPLPVPLTHLNQLAFQHVTILAVEFHIENPTHIRRTVGICPACISREPYGVTKLIASIVHVHVYLLLRNGPAEGCLPLCQFVSWGEGRQADVRLTQGRIPLAVRLLLSRLGKAGHLFLTLGQFHHLGRSPQQGVISCLVRGIQHIPSHGYALSPVAQFRSGEAEQECLPMKLRSVYLHVSMVHLGHPVGVTIIDVDA